MMRKVFAVKADMPRESEQTYLTGKKRKKTPPRLMKLFKMPVKTDYLDIWRKRMRSMKI